MLLRSSPTKPSSSAPKNKTVSKQLDCILGKKAKIFMKKKKAGNTQGQCEMAVTQLKLSSMQRSCKNNPYNIKISQLKHLKNVGDIIRKQRH